MAKKAASSKPAATDSLPPKAQALLDAQVDWWVERLSPAALAPWLSDEIAALLQDAAKIKLKEVVSCESVQAVACHYAAETEPSGAIPELVGEIARSVQAHPAQQSTKLVDLLPDQHFEHWLEKILELKSTRDALIHAALGNPVMHTVAGDLLYRGISGYLSQSSLVKGIPGAQSALKFGKSLLARATPKLDSAIEETLRKYIQQSLETTLRESEASLQTLLTNQLLRETAREIWLGLKNQPLAKLRKTVSHDDVEEVFVIAYEHWRSVRKSDYYRAMIEAGVAAFYEKYGDATLAELLQELGLSHETLLQDALRFAPDAIAGLKKKKLLAPLIRRQIAPFFASESALRLLAD